MSGSKVSQANNTQNISHIMNNLNLLSQKTYFDSFVNKHIKSKDTATISSNEGRPINSTRGSNFATSKTTKANRGSTTRHSVAYDRD